MLSIRQGSDSEQKISFTLVGNQKNWTIPSAIWNTLYLSSTENLNTFINSELPETYFKTHDSVLLVTENKPKYDHFSAYWSIENSKDSTSDKKLLLLLKENMQATIQASSSAQDLISNETIQTELPKIKEIATQISSHAKNREEQIQMILNYLDQNYVYDDEMIKNNVIRPLTTEEALNRGKGVCQHYSVIFTAVARALKIPTRIVTGYSLLEKNPGLHAWVESEIKEGTWLVIEPQDKTTLTAMRTRFYLPTARGALLEDKNTVGIADDADFYNQYILKPAK